ncbi:hypothetical protein D3C80_2011060 [compost metagenome]
MPTTSNSTAQISMTTARKQASRRREGCGWNTWARPLIESPWRRRNQASTAKLSSAGTNRTMPIKAPRPNCCWPTTAL